MPNLSAIAPYTTAATALSGLILVSPQSTVGYQPQNPANSDGTPSTTQQPPTFVFNYEGEQTALIESDITDHFAEDNTALEDQIALKPEIITTHGFIGELNDVVPAALAPIKFLANKLTAIGAYAPSLSVTALIAYQEAFFAYQVAATLVDSAVSAWSSVSNLLDGSNGQSVIGSAGLSAASAQNDQQTAFQQLYGYWRSRTLFTVQTPWAVFQNMAIQSMRAIQDAETNVITDFEVKFKMIRFAGTSLTGLQLLGGQAKTQAEGLIDQGVGSTVEGPSVTSAISGILA